MAITKKLEKRQQQIKRLTELEAKAKNYRGVKESLQGELEKCRAQIAQAKDGPRRKRKGIIWLLVGLALLAVEVMCVMEIIPGYSDVDPIDFVIMGIPLLIGIRNLVKAGKAKGSETLQTLKGRESSLLERLDALEKEARELEGLRMKLAYTGKDWDITTFVASPSNVAAMEDDLEDLFIALKYTDDPAAFANSWLAKNEMIHLTAILNQNQRQMQAFDRGTKEMKNAGSWKLEIALLVTATLSINLMNVAMSGGKGKGADFYEIYDGSDVRKPKNAEEEAFLELVEDVSWKLSYHVSSKLKQMQNK